MKSEAYQTSKYVAVMNGDTNALMVAIADLTVLEKAQRIVDSDTHQIMEGITHISPNGMELFALLKARNVHFCPMMHIIARVPFLSQMAVEIGLYDTNTPKYCQTYTNGKSNK